MKNEINKEAINIIKRLLSNKELQAGGIATNGKTISKQYNIPIEVIETVGVLLFDCVEKTKKALEDEKRRALYVFE